MTILAKGITKTYPGLSAPVLTGVDFTCEPGTLTWIAGESGSGKSSLLNVLGLLTDPDSGSMTIDGTEYLSAPESRRRSARRDLISTIFQHGNLFGHLTVEANVEMGLASANDDAVKDALEAIGMAHRIGQRAGLLSGGEHQRVAIARAMVRRSRLILADEPYASLDARTASIVMEQFQKATAEGATVVLVSHDERTADIATAHYVLEGGRLL